MGCAWQRRDVGRCHNDVTVAGDTTIISDPDPAGAGSSPEIRANGAAAVVTLASAAGTFVHLGSLSLSGGAQLVLRRQARRHAAACVGGERRACD